MDSTMNNAEIIKLFIDTVFVKHDMSMLDQIMRDDYIQHNPDCAQGKTGFKEFFETIFAAMPDFKYSLKKIAVQDDIVMAYCSTSGTHTGGPWLGKQATGNKLEYDVVDIFRIQDGKIAEHWDVADTFKLFSQLGIIERLLTNR